MKWETQGTETLRFTRGGSGTWRQYRVQARDEVGGRAEHMVTPRRAASATWNPQCEEGMVTPRCAVSATWNPHVDVKGLEDAAGTGLWQCRRGRTGRYVEGPGASIGCRQETR